MAIKEYEIQLKDDEENELFPKTYFKYSTEEQFTGKYSNDGKKIYIKDVYIGNLPNNGSKSKSHNISNFRSLESAHMRWYDSVDNCWFFDFRYDSASIFCKPSNINNTNVKVIAMGTNWSNRTSDCWITIEYTKTTDN